MSLFQDLLIWPSVAVEQEEEDDVGPFIFLSCGAHQGLSDDFSRTLSESLGMRCRVRSAPRGVITLWESVYERERGTRREICTMMCVTSEN